MNTEVIISYIFAALLGALSFFLAAGNRRAQKSRPALFFIKTRNSEFSQTDIHKTLNDQTLQLFFRKHGISQCEGEIIKLLLDGKSNSDIEKELFISLSTAKNHIYNIYQKLQVKNRVQISLMIPKFARTVRA